MSTRQTSSGWVSVVALVSSAWVLLVAANLPAQGPGGGMRGFLERLDTNGNGMIDPEEAEGRARFFLERLARDNPDLDLSRPIPIDTLVEQMERQREQSGRDRGSRDRGSRDRGSSDREESTQRGDQRQQSSRSTTPEPPEPLVPGFGVPQDLAPVPGFGDAAEFFSVQVTDSDIQQAERIFSRLDRNKDGVLDADEVRRGRWRDDPFQYDRNGDGKLTVNELAVRNAHRRIAQESDQQQTDAGENQRSEQRSESSGRPSGRSGWSGRRGSRSDGESNSSERSRTNRSEEADETPRSYRFLSPIERLPKGLPDWFAELDANQDGQLTMAEFSSQWSDAIAAEFAQFDLNGDGIITARECLAAIRDGAERNGGSAASSRSSTPSAFSRFSRGSRSAPTRPSSPSTASTRPDRSATGASSSSTANEDEPEADEDEPDGEAATDSNGIDANYLRYAAGIIEKYDLNGDGVLTVDEWSRMPKTPEGADRNGDGRITVEELARFYTER